MKSGQEPSKRATGSKPETKPSALSNDGSPSSKRARRRKTASIAHIKANAGEASSGAGEENVPSKSDDKGKPFTIVGIGASAGGYEAITEILKYFPTDTGMAYAVVQHLDPTHESQLTE